MDYFKFQIKTALDNFRRNKIRTFLTSLGIMIGVLSVVMLIALGLGLKNYIEQQFESMGSNLLMVMSGSGFSSEGGGLGGSLRSLFGGIELDEKDVKTVSRVSGLDYVVPVFFKSSVVKVSNEEELGYIFGTNGDIFTLLNLEPEEGVLLSQAEMQKRSKNVVLGGTLAEKLFDSPGNAINKTIRFENQRFKVVGVLKNKGDPEMDSAIYMSYKTTFGSINPDKTFFAIYLGVDDEDNVSAVKKDVENALLKRYDEEDFSVTEQTEILETVNTIFGMINAVLIAIGSISLIVGGIGIMNIMYANVTERIKEIGILRALGATKRDILFQFLTESVLLSVLGGVTGLGISSLIVLLVRPFFPLEINTLAVGLAIGVSSLIGIFFGVFPARRASNFTPIEAIRYE